MIQTINDKIRQRLINKRSRQVTQINIENLDYNLYDDVISLFLADYYKVKFFEALNTKNFQFLQNFNSNKQDVINRTYKDPDFLNEILECVYLFDELPVIYKISVLDELSFADQDENLMQISKLHMFDKMAYTFKYDLESFKEYYKDFMKRESTNDKKTEISFLIADKILDYRKENLNEFKKIILEIIKVYYKWNIYVKNNCPKNSLYMEDIFYLNAIEKKSISDLISLAEKDIQFLTTILDSYLIYTSGTGDISQKLINEYFNDHVDIEIQKKLKRD